MNRAIVRFAALIGLLFAGFSQYVRAEEKALGPLSNEEIRQQMMQAAALVPENERGNIYKLTSSMFGVYRSDDTKRQKEYCIPSGYALRIGPTEPNGLLSLTITDIAKKMKGGKIDVLGNDGKITKEAHERMCMKSDGKAREAVDSHYRYMTDAANIAASDAYRYGWTFGALVVPFKFYVGGDKKLSASTTLAPYFGYTLGNFRGMNVSFLVSAGLGLVPIDDPAGETETKPAFSTAAGVLLTTQKNARWSSGLLLGADFVSDADRKRDPVSNDLWLSVFIGREL